MAKQRIFMTGGSGYIGSAVTELAISCGYEVYSLSRTEASDAKLTALGATPVRGDLNSLDVLRQQSAAADIVFHLADSLTDDWGQDYAKVVATDAAAVDAMGAGLEGTHKPFVVTSGSLVVAATGAETDEDSPLWTRIHRCGKSRLTTASSPSSTPSSSARRAFASLSSACPPSSMAVVAAELGCS